MILGRQFVIELILIDHADEQWANMRPGYQVFESSVIEPATLAEAHPAVIDCERGNEDHRRRSQGLGILANRWPGHLADAK